MTRKLESLLLALLMLLGTACEESPEADAELDGAAELDSATELDQHDLDLEDGSCSTDEDCAFGQRCVFLQCESYIPVEIESDLPDLPEEILNCEGVAPVGGDLLINEVFSAPRSGEDDSNCDGDPSSTQDEFIELVNASSQTLSLNGIEIHVGGKKKTTLIGCLQPGRGAVIYAGGAAQCSLGGTLALVSEVSLSLTNAGTLVTLMDGGSELDRVSVPSLSGTSYVRSPDFAGTEFKKHNEISSLRFSAGTCTSGGELLIGCPSTPPPDGEDVEMNDQGDVSDIIALCETVPAPGDLRLNEVFPAAQTGDDSNCDGAYSANSEEFIELVNNADTQLNLDGIELKVDGLTKLTLSGCLDANHGLVIYGGGAPSCELGSTLALVSSFSMNNDATHSIVLRLGESDLDAVAVPNLNGSRSSYTRSPDFTGTWAEHSTVAATRFSAGLCSGGGELVKGCP